MHTNSKTRMSAIEEDSCIQIDATDCHPHAALDRNELPTCQFLITVPTVTSSIFLGSHPCECWSGIENSDAIGIPWFSRMHRTSMLFSPWFVPSLVPGNPGEKACSWIDGFRPGFPWRSRHGDT